MNKIRRIRQFIDLIKRKNTKQIPLLLKRTGMLTQFYKTTFYKYHNIKKFTSDFFTTKQKDLNEFKTNLVLSYEETIGIKLTNEDQNKIIYICIYICIYMYIYICIYIYVYIYMCVCVCLCM